MTQTARQGRMYEEDALMVHVMDAPPERLYRPDIAITEWRRLCQVNEKAVPRTLAAPAAVGASGVVEPKLRTGRTAATPRRISRGRFDERAAVRDDTRLERHGRLPITHGLRILVNR